MPSKEGRIADNGWANCNSPLHVCYPNVGKYYMQIASRAWHRFFCVRRRGELKFAHTAICPCYKFVHIVNSSILKFAHTTIRPCCNSSILQIYPILQNSPILQIHLCFQLPLMGGRIALKGRANCPQRKGELPTMDGRIAIRPYTCIFWMLANLHVIKYKYTCEYLNTCKLMIERIYIPT